MAELTRGLLDTSIVIDHDVIDHALLPDESAIAAITLAELAADDYARLRCYEQKAFHVTQLPSDVVDELGSVAIPETAAKFDNEYQP